MIEAAPCCVLIGNAANRRSNSTDVQGVGRKMV